MKFTVLEEKDNPVMKRRELLLSLDYGLGSTASKAELQKAISEQMKAGIDSVEIDKISSDIGRPFGKAWVRIWKDKKIEAYKTKNEQKAEESKQQEAPKQEAKPEEKSE